MLPFTYASVCECVLVCARACASVSVMPMVATVCAYFHNYDYDLSVFMCTVFIIACAAVAL